MGILRKLERAILDLLFPPVCIACKKHLAHFESMLCDICYRGISIKKFAENSENLTILSVGSYGDPALKALIQSLKYERHMKSADLIKGLVHEWAKPFLEAGMIEPNESLIIPVPLHPKRQRKRGFNQAEVISDILSGELKITIDKNLIKRVKDTKPQVGARNAEAREKNIKNAFALGKGAGDKIKGKIIILVDDVYTSGSTIKEAARIINRADPAEVIAFVLAKA